MFSNLIAAEGSSINRRNNNDWSPLGDTTIGWKMFRSIVLRSRINLIDCKMVNDPATQPIDPIIATLSKEDIFKRALIRPFNVLQVRA